MSELNIYQKLIKVRQAVEFLKKDKKNIHFGFEYVSSSQTLASIRAAMDEQQLLLVPSITNSETTDHTTSKGGHQYFTILNMKYTWINAEKPEETVECFWIGHGLDEGEKGTGKAVTYSEKSFILKFFNVPTDKEDPDSSNGQNKKTTGKKPPADDMKAKEVIVKIATDILTLTKLEAPENATDEEKNRIYGDLFLKRIGKKNSKQALELPYKDLCTIHGMLKKEVAKFTKEIPEQSAQPESSSESGELPF